MLHLLRPMTEWNWKGRHLTTIQEAKSYVDEIAAQGWDQFYTATTRAPRRVEELLDGGSVYFVRGGLTLFRMPLIAIDDQRTDVARRYLGTVLIVMEPRLIAVEQRRIGFLRGWRYMKDEDKPPDLPPIEIAEVDMPPDMVADLKRQGLL